MIRDRNSSKGVGLLGSLRRQQGMHYAAFCSSEHINNWREVIWIQKLHFSEMAWDWRIFKGGFLLNSWRSSSDSPGSAGGTAPVMLDRPRDAGYGTWSEACALIAALSQIPWDLRSPWSKEKWAAGFYSAPFSLLTCIDLEQDAKVGGRLPHNEIFPLLPKDIKNYKNYILFNLSIKL